MFETIDQSKNIVILKKKADRKIFGSIISFTKNVQIYVIKTNVESGRSNNPSYFRKNAIR